GTVDTDLQNDPIGKDKDGNDVYLKDIWPSMASIREAVQSVVNPDISVQSMMIYLHLMKNGIKLKQLMNHYMNGQRIQHIFRIHHSLKDCPKSQILLNH